jgi:hypothetical protein
VLETQDLYQDIGYLDNTQDLIDKSEANMEYVKQHLANLRKDPNMGNELAHLADL